MRIVCNEQHTREWHKAKLGIVSASQVWRAMDALKVKSKNGSSGDPSSEQLKYRDELAMEILSGAPVEHWVSPEMDAGTALEPKARQEYIFRNDCPELAWQTGFVLHPTMDRLGASPDLLIKPNLGAEFKCPKLNTHLGYLFAYAKAIAPQFSADKELIRAPLTGNELAEAVMPEKYLLQAHTVIACCELDALDWVSYYPSDSDIGDDLRDGKPWLLRPDIPDELKYLQIRVERDEKKIAEIEDKVEVFNERLLEYLDTMKSILCKR